MFKFCMISIVFSLMLLLVTAGCDNSRASIPVEKIDLIEEADLKSYVLDLHEEDPETVYHAMQKIAEYGNGATKAVPFLSAMLNDRRIVRLIKYNIIRYVPLFKEAAITIVRTGPDGVGILVDLLKNMPASEGGEDDFYREGISAGLKTAVGKYGENVFLKFNKTDKVLYVIDTIAACLNLSASPGRWDKSDPRKNLKLYRHFNEASTREGLLIYIKILGMIGDARALGVLSSIAPISVKSDNKNRIDGFDRFQRAAAVSQYTINPQSIRHLKPEAVQVLFMDFISSGKASFIAGMLKDGLSPDTKSLTGEPAVSYALRKNLSIFNLLAEAGADLNCRLSKNDTMLIKAARNGDYGFVESLLAKGASVIPVNNAKETALIVAFTAFLDKWNGSDKDKNVDDYFKLLNLLNTSGSPLIPSKLIKALSKKQQKIIKTRTGISG